MDNSFTDVEGIKVGHYTDLENITGCTVILCPKGAVAGVDQRGGAPGSRELALLNPINQVQEVHAILLSGGSAYGLDAASGVMRYLEENDIGVNVGSAKVPIVPAAIILDLGIGNAKIRPTSDNAYTACQNATDSVREQGSIGAGTGATVGKLLGMGSAMKAGLGMASIEIGKGVVVSAIMVVNAVGEIIDPKSNQVLAGARNPEIAKKVLNKKEMFVNSLELMRGPIGRTIFDLAAPSNTVIGVVATNARLNKIQATKVAQMAQNGLARTIRPTNTMLDGDTMFALSTGKKKINPNIIGAFATEVVSTAIINAVQYAKGLGGIPGIADLNQS